jgi:hypothetical protein
MASTWRRRSVVRLTAEVLEDVLAFASSFGLGLYPWQRDAFGQTRAARHGCLG